jgi:hypothetical protein
LRLDPKLFVTLCLLKSSRSTPLAAQQGLQAPLEEVKGSGENEQGSRSLHGRFLHITGKAYGRLVNLSICSDYVQTSTLTPTTNCMHPRTKKALAIEGVESLAHTELRQATVTRHSNCSMRPSNG